MDEKMTDLIISMIKDLDTRLDKMTIIMARQNAQLAEHMKRSELNEQALEVLKGEVKPIQEHVLKINFLMKIFAVIGGIIGAVYTILQIAAMSR